MACLRRKMDRIRESGGQGDSPLNLAVKSAIADGRPGESIEDVSLLGQPGGATAKVMPPLLLLLEDVVLFSGVGATPVRRVWPRGLHESAWAGTRCLVWMIKLWGERRVRTMDTFCRTRGSSGRRPGGHVTPRKALGSVGGGDDGARGRDEGGPRYF